MRTLLTIAVVILIQTAAAQAAPDYHYEGTMSIAPDTGHIAMDWNITLKDDAQYSVVFLLRNTLSDIRASGPSVKSVELGSEEGLAEFTSVRIELNSETGPRVIELSYAGILLPEPMDNQINEITSDRIELNVDSFWLPMDSSFEKVFTSDLKVTAGTGWQGATTGEARSIDNGFRFISTEPDIDISFTLTKNAHITESDGFVIYDMRANQAGTDKLLAAVRHCVRYLNDRFGAHDPLPRGKLLITERPSSGYARRNYIVFTDIKDTKPEPLTRFVCHEFSHYWNRGAAFNTVENWLNEAFAEYMGVMAVRARYGDTAYDTMLDSFQKQIADKELPPIWQPGDTARGPYLNQYRQGPLALARLEKDLGSTLFLQFIQEFLAQQTRTTPKLLAILERMSNKEQRKRFEDNLAGRPTAIDAAKVMILGTFHFKDAGLDSVKVEDFNIMSPASQTYLSELTDRLAEFAPTKVLVEYEVSKDPDYFAKYRQYLDGDLALPANEIYQLGFRIAKKAGLDQLHGFDERAAGWEAEPMFEYGKAHQAPEMDQFEAVIAKITEDESQARKTKNLQELLLRQNSADSERANMDIYLLTNSIGAHDGYAGADAAASWWRRNFRMYANLQHIAEPGERLLVIGGTGHTAILKQLLAIDQRLTGVDVTPVLKGQ